MMGNPVGNIWNSAPLEQNVVEISFDSEPLEKRTSIARFKFSQGLFQRFERLLCFESFVKRRFEQRDSFLKETELNIVSRPSSHAFPRNIVEHNRGTACSKYNCCSSLRQTTREDRTLTASSDCHRFQRFSGYCGAEFLVCGILHLVQQRPPARTLPQ